MTGRTEQALRAHLEERASGLDEPADWAGLVARVQSRNRSRVTSLALSAAVVLALAVTATALASLDVGGSSSVTAASSATSHARALPNGGESSGAAAAPGLAQRAAAGRLDPLFRRITADGVAIRAYYTAPTPTPLCPTGPPGVVCTAPACPVGAVCAAPACPAGAVCPTPSCPPGAVCPTPSCPPGAMCATPACPASASGSASASASASAACAAPACTTGGVVVELSDAGAVATVSAPLYVSSGPAPPPVAVIASGEFGEAEATPAAYVVVHVGSGVSSVKATFADGATDTATPAQGIAVLARAGSAPVQGQIQALDPSGHVVGSATFAPAVPLAPAVSPTPPLGTPCAGLPTAPATNRSSG